jgi:YggT family protein
VEIICIALTIYWWVLIAAILSTWIPMFTGRPPTGVVRSIIDGLHAITEPVFRPVRSLLPPIRMGGMGLDLSPIIVFIVLSILRGVVC